MTTATAVCGEATGSRAQAAASTILNQRDYNKVS